MRDIGLAIIAAALFLGAGMAFAASGLATNSVGHENADVPGAAFFACGVAATILHWQSNKSKS